MAPIEPTYDDVNPDLLAPMVEQPEPSDRGDWYVIDIRDLTARGYTHIQFHFPYEYPHEGVALDAASLVKDPDPVDEPAAPKVAPLAKTLNVFAADFINMARRGLFERGTCTQDEALGYVTDFLGSARWRPAAIALLAVTDDVEAGDTVEVNAQGRPQIIRAGGGDVNR